MTGGGCRGGGDYSIPIFILTLIKGSIAPKRTLCRLKRSSLLVQMARRISIWEPGGGGAVGPWRVRPGRCAAARHLLLEQPERCSQEAHLHRSANRYHAVAIDPLEARRPYTIATDAQWLTTE